MLEGPAEQRILRAGQWLADQFAYGRINRRFASFTKTYIKQNRVQPGRIARATLMAARESLFVRRRPRSFTTLRFYALVLGDLHPGLVDEVEYWRWLHRSWGGKSRAASDAKTLTKKLLGTRQIPDLGYFVNHNWFDAEWNRVTRSDIVATLDDVDQVVVKADFSERGNSVRVLSKDQFLADDFSIHENSVVQRKIEQHPLLGQLIPGKESTIRLVTAFWQSSTEPRLLSGLVKWDVLGTDYVTRIKLDVGTGNFVPPIVRTNWEKLPLAEEFQAGIPALPGFHEAVSLVLGLHAKFPHYQLIGWDLGIDANSRPWIFEWNADHPAIFTAQAMNGPILAEGKSRV